MAARKIPTVPQRALAGALERHRAAAGLSPRDAAAQLEWSETKIWRIETARVTVSPGDVRELARVYGVDVEATEALVQLAEEAERHLTGPAQATWFARLETEYANLRAAYEWSQQDSDASLGMRLATAPFILWQVRGPLLEGLDWLLRAVSRPEAAAPSLAT
jgi:transcriptional regulator with XRE-family HTH domain